MSRMRYFFKEWIPPILLRIMRLVYGGGTQFEGNYASWGEAAAKCSGYDGEHILTKVLDATLKVKRGEAAFERDSVLFDAIEFDWPVLAGLMWVAARNDGRLSVLDFGGALGSSYFQNRKYFENLSRFHWGVVEQVHYVEAGKKYLQDQRLRFYKSTEECVADIQPNVILVSSTLQYIEKPYELLNEFVNEDVDVLIISRTPFVEDGNDIIAIQTVPASIFSATLPCWLFSKSKVLDALARKNFALMANIPDCDFESNRFKISGVILMRNSK